jgi:hypothetical protein
MPVEQHGAEPGMDIAVGRGVHNQQSQVMSAIQGLRQSGREPEELKIRRQSSFGQWNLIPKKSQQPEAIDR